MFQAKLFLTLILAFIATMCMAAPRFHITRSKIHCSLPERQYMFGNYSIPTSSMSDLFVMLTKPVTDDQRTASFDPLQRANPPVRIKAFQFTTKPVLNCRHCFVSDMSIQLFSDGRWIVSVRADQNPRDLTDMVTTESTVTSSEPAGIYTGHLQGNSFLLWFDCLSLSKEETVASSLGKVRLAVVTLDRVWVQKGIPKHYYAEGYHPAIAERFELIDRTEIHFGYRGTQYGAAAPAGITP